MEISERGYAGSAEEMIFDGGTPLRITWEKRGDEFHVPVKASEATIDILCCENFHYLSLFTSDPRQFRVSIFRNGRLYWRGFVSADLYSENFTAPPYLVSIKAVDGFNLLSSIPFRDLLGVGVTGRCSLWKLLSACMDLLELEVDVADWMDLYAEGMDENSSPLRQTFIDLERLYYVYEEPTYRDILELCLRPFAGQIFQSNGALHIRRAVSLYRTARPVSFYRVGTEYPVGRIVAGSGFRLVIHPGTQVVTSASRERVEDMWSGALHVMGESVMDIVPALRKVEVGVENKSLSNLIDYLGFYDLGCWEKQHKFLSLSKADELCFGGDDDCRGEEVCTKGFPVAQCNYPLTLEYTIRTRRNEWGFGWVKPGGNHIVAVHYGVRIIGEKATWSLLDTGGWAQGDYEIVSEAKVGEEQNFKIEMQGIPCDGEWVFFFRQTLIGKITSIGDGYRGGSRTSGHLESATFKKMTLTMDADDIYDKGLRYESLIDPANNVDMSVKLPISDIPAIPNDHLLYALYFLDAQGKPTRLWHAKGRSDYDTLVGHIVQGALRYKQLPSRRLTGEIFTGRHVDMNTVVRDEKFLHAGFYVNSIELNAVDDSYDTELVEMPGLIRSERPPEGDDCIAIAEVDFPIEKIVRSANQLLLRSADHKVYVFDAATARVREIYRSSLPFEIYPADGGFVVVDGKNIYLSDLRGTVKKIFAPEKEYDDLGTYMDGYFYILGEEVHYPRVSRSTRASTEPTVLHYLYRPEFKYEADDLHPRRGSGHEGTTMQGDIRGMLRTANTIVINTSHGAYLHDKRFHIPAKMMDLDAGSKVVTISDDYIGLNLDDEFLIYRRDAITERTLIHRGGRCADFADHTMSEFAHCFDDGIRIWNIHDNATVEVRNTAGLGQTIRGLFFITGDLYIVRERTIYKYIP